MSLDQIKISVVQREMHGFYHVGFSKRINFRGEDFHVFVNEGYTPKHGDSELLQTVIFRLIDAEIGLDNMRVLPSTLELHTNGANTLGDILFIVNEAVSSIGFEPVEV